MGVLDYDSENDMAIPLSRMTNLFYDSLGAVEPEERRVVEMHYGRLRKTYSIPEIAAEMRIGEEEVRELKKLALDKMVKHIGDVLELEE